MNPYLDFLPAVPERFRLFVLRNNPWRVVSPPKKTAQSRVIQTERWRMGNFLGLGVQRNHNTANTNFNFTDLISKDAAAALGSNAASKLGDSAVQSAAIARDGFVQGSGIVGDALLNSTRIASDGLVRSSTIAGDAVVRSTGIARDGLVNSTGIFTQGWLWRLLIYD